MSAGHGLAHRLEKKAAWSLAWLLEDLLVHESLEEAVAHGCFPLAATLQLPGRTPVSVQGLQRPHCDLWLLHRGAVLPLTPSPLLFQQVKSIERFLRRLEFHASKVRAGAVLGAPCCPQPFACHCSSGLSLQIDELYEAYCIQRRLRDGAHNMVKAYSTGSPGSREARESLAEASKGYKEYTEVRQLAGWAGRVLSPWLAAHRSCPSICLFPEHVSVGE